MRSRVQSGLVGFSRLPFTTAGLRCKGCQGLQPSGGSVLHNNRMKLTGSALAFASAAPAAYPGVSGTERDEDATQDDQAGGASRLTDWLRTPARGAALQPNHRAVTPHAIEGQAARQPCVLVGDAGRARHPLITTPYAAGSAARRPQQVPAGRRRAAPHGSQGRHPLVGARRAGTGTLWSMGPAGRRPPRGISSGLACWAGRRYSSHHGGVPGVWPASLVSRSKVTKEHAP